MLHFHSFWMAPQRDGTNPADRIPMRLDDYEALTWLASALAAKQLGPVRLITDDGGLEFVRRVGLDRVYDGGISTALNAVPDDIDPLLFWTAGKIFAWTLIDEPAVQLDPDAILWGPLPSGPDVQMLHEENPLWPDYRGNRDRFNPDGLDDDGWDWDIRPCNAGIVAFRDPAKAREFAESALQIMSTFSRRSRDLGYWGLSRATDFAEAPVFVEQRFLPMLARRRGWTLGTLGEMKPHVAHLESNPLCCHLWHSKSFYLECREARAALVNHLADRLWSHHPESREILERWQLDRPVEPGRYPEDPPLNFPVRGHRPTFVLLGRVNGVVTIRDPTGLSPSRSRWRPGGSCRDAPCGTRHFLRSH